MRRVHRGHWSLHLELDSILFPMAAPHLEVQMMLINKPPITGFDVLMYTTIPVRR